MIQSIINFFKGPSEDFSALIKDGAVIVDVRTSSEFAGGHIQGSLNIPLNQLSSQLSKLDKNRVIITCCASGMRSASAKEILKAAGYLKVYNGGGWTTLQGKLR